MIEWKRFGLLLAFDAIMRICMRDAAYTGHVNADNSY